MQLLFVQGGTDPCPFFLNLEEYLGPPPRTIGGGGGAGGGEFRGFKDQRGNLYKKQKDASERLSRRIDEVFEELEPAKAAKAAKAAKDDKKSAVIKDNLTTRTVKNDFIIESEGISAKILKNNQDIQILEATINGQKKAKLEEDEFMMLLAIIASEPFI